MVADEQLCLRQVDGEEGGNANKLLTTHRFGLNIKLSLQLWDSYGPSGVQIILLVLIGLKQEVQAEKTGQEGGSLGGDHGRVKHPRVEVS